MLRTADHRAIAGDDRVLERRALMRAKPLYAAQSRGRLEDHDAVGADLGAQRELNRGRIDAVETLPRGLAHRLSGHPARPRRHLLQPLERETPVEAQEEQADLHGERVIEEAVEHRGQGRLELDVVLAADGVERILERDRLPQIEILDRRRVPVDARERRPQGREEGELRRGEPLGRGAARGSRRSAAASCARPGNASCRSRCARRP